MWNSLKWWLFETFLPGFAAEMDHYRRLAFLAVTCGCSTCVQEQSKHQWCACGSPKCEKIKSQNPTAWRSFTRAQSYRLA